MKLKWMNLARYNHRRSVVLFSLSLVAALSFGVLAVARAAADGTANSADDAAIREAVAGFSNGWNAHDAHAMCLSLADDVDWVNWRGEPLASRQAVEDEHARLFADLYKDTHRTDVVKTIHYLSPELASVDDYWTMTGARKRDRSEWPYRAGYANWVMAKRNGRWIVLISRTADFNAQAPK